MAHFIAKSGSSRAFLIGSMAVISGLSGLYLIIRHNQRKQVERGTNPYHEQILAHVAKGESRDTLPAMHSQSTNIPPAFPGKDHHSGHSTISNFKSTPEYAESGPAARNMVPPPQRDKTDGSGTAYTKSPDYVQNYEKTVRPGKIRENVS